MPRKKISLDGKTKHVNVIVSEDMYNDCMNLVGYGGYVSLADVVRRSLQRTIDDNNDVLESESIDEDEWSPYIGIGGGTHLRVDAKWLKRYGSMKLGTLIEELSNSPTSHAELEQKYGTRIDVTDTDDSMAGHNDAGEDYALDE